MATFRLTAVKSCPLPARPYIARLTNFTTWMISRNMTSRIILCILIFYRKLVVPSLAAAFLTSFSQYGPSGDYPWALAAASYIVMSLVFQLFIYEVRNPGEYYFYHNMGLSKPALWGSTLLLSSLVAWLSLKLGPLCM